MRPAGNFLAYPGREFPRLPTEQGNQVLCCPAQCGIGEIRFLYQRGISSSHRIVPVKLTSRAQAREAGLKRYFSGEPCTQGHVAERYTSGNGCVECDNIRGRAKYAADPGFKIAQVQRAKKNRKPGTEEEQLTFGFFGALSSAELNSYCESIDSKCQICEKPFDSTKVSARSCVDHDHQGGTFRGLLCSRCNGGLGIFGDNLEGVLRAVRYLQLDRTASIFSRTAGKNLGTNPAERISQIGSDICEATDLKRE